jgi:hypothetical protein
MCEALSGIREKRNGEEPTDDYSRYKFFNRHETTSVLKYLNLADLKQLTVRSFLLIHEFILEQNNEECGFQPLSRSL